MGKPAWIGRLHVRDGFDRAIMMELACFENTVDSFYQPLLRFAVRLAKEPADAADLTQETFYIWATKGHQLRDPAKLGPWLFRTLYRLHLGAQQRAGRFPPIDTLTAESEFLNTAPEPEINRDAGIVFELLGEIEEVYKTPLMMFYVDNCPYAEIALRMGIPRGTVMSRISRGKAQLRRLVYERERALVPRFGTARDAMDLAFQR